MRKILSLFDYSGEWSRPYREAGYDVRQVDLQLGMDVRDEKPGDYHGILAAPPCTHFSVSGNQHWPAKDADGRTDEHVALVCRVLQLIYASTPRWWAIENPVGRIEKLVPELSNVQRFWFNPCDYGDPYTKKTGIWGDFTPPLPLFATCNPVEPTEGSKMHLVPPGPERQNIRSKTPAGFARAFFEANP